MTPYSVAGGRWLKPFAHLFGHPSLWHLNRRSAPRAVAIGLFAALIIPVGQFMLAALLAVPLRANVPLAALCTLLSNPFTFPPIYVAAYSLGRALIGTIAQPSTVEVGTSLVGKAFHILGPTALGLSLFAIGGAVLGYVSAVTWWRWRLVRRWRLRGTRVSGGEP